MLNLETTLDYMTGSGLVPSSPLDQAKAILCIRAATASGDRQAAIHIVKAKRNAHRQWLTVVQREWQSKTRRPTRARHHDSIAIREKYVRCS